MPVDSSIAGGSGAAPAVHIRVAPQVRRLDGVERPRDLPGVDVERGDDPAIAAGVEARLVAGNGACVHQAVGRDGLDVDPRRWTLYERRPSLVAGRRVEGSDRVLAAGGDHAVAVEGRSI